MKQVNFKKITAQNFLSIGLEPVEIEFKLGLNIITGFNRDEGDIKNGLGKTSVLSSIYFAIFGTTPNDLPKQYIPNRKIGRNCRVVLEFENITPSRGCEYFVIERTLAPSRVRVWKNNEEKTKSTIPETNRYIREVLSANEEVFLDCIFMRANSTIPFMAKKKVDKKNFIESIFDLGVFSDMLKVMKDEVKELRRSYDIENTEYNSLINNEERYIQSIADIEYLNIKKNQEKDSKIVAIKELINESRKNIDSLRPLVIEIDNSKEKEVQERLSKCQTYMRAIYKKDAEYQAQMKLFQIEYKKLSNMGDVCPTCGKPYDSSETDHRKNRMLEIGVEAKSIKKLIDELAEKSKKIDNLSYDLQEQLSEARRTASNVAVIKERIRAHENKIELLMNQIQEIENSQDASVVELTRLLNECRIKMLEKKEIVDKLELELSMMNVCEFILSDVGVRKFIVGQLLELLNGRIKFYLAAFKSTFDFTFDDKFEENIRDINGVECLYANCSGAEAKKIDLAISFAFLDVLKYHQLIEYNISFFDEILDSSVDAKSLEGIIDFISNQSYENGKCTYIVTHKTDVALPNVSEYVMLEKVNGFTRRIEED